MISYVIAVRDKSTDELAFVREEEFKEIAEGIALRLFRKYTLDTVLVIKVNPAGRIPEEEFEEMSKLSRDCKHWNVQFTFSGARVCTSCGMELKSYTPTLYMDEHDELEDVLVEKGREVVIEKGR